MSRATWRRLVDQFREEEECDQDAWETEWPERLGLAWERVCIELDSDDVHPDIRLQALAYVAAWCELGARAEDERRRKHFNTIAPFYGQERKRERQERSSTE